MAMITTMRGKRIDITQILSKHENAIAIGNLNMNARGDLLGPGGTIKKRNEEIVSEYYRSSPKAVKQVSLRNLTPDVFDTPAAAVADLAQRKKAAAEPKPEQKRPRKLSDNED